MGIKNVLIWNGISQLGQSGIQFIATIILAKMLTPEDFGVIGAVTIFIAFSQMVVDSEMGGALLKKKDIRPVDYSTLFTYNLAVGIILYILLYFIAPVVASFYNKPLLVGVIRVLSITVVIQAFRVVPRVIILRNLQFRGFALINIISGLLSLVIAILLAKYGYQYWALVYQQIASIVIMVILFCIYNRYFPTIGFSIDSFKYQFSFGIGLLGADTLRTIAANINVNVIAKILPLTIVGYFTQTSRVTNFGVSFINGILDQTIFPLLAKKDDPYEVIQIYRKITVSFLYLLSFLCVFITVESRQIIIVLLGEQWISADWMLSILSVSILPQAMQSLSRNLLKTDGSTRRVFSSEIFKSVVIIIALLGSTVFGLKAIIWAYVIAQMASAGWIMVECSRATCYPIKAQLSDYMPIVLIAIVSWIMTILILKTVQIQNIWIELALSLPIILSCFVIVTHVFKKKVIITNLFQYFLKTNHS